MYIILTFLILFLIAAIVLLLRKKYYIDRKNVITIVEISKKFLKKNRNKPIYIPELYAYLEAYKIKMDTDNFFTLRIMTEIKKYHLFLILLKAY